MAVVPSAESIATAARESDGGIPMTVAPARADVGPIDRNVLVIDRIETIALRAPLGRRFTGKRPTPWTTRCTIVTRLYTRDGLVSEVFTGDTDAEQSLIVGIIHDELAPQLLGMTATDPEGCWRRMEPATNDILRDRGLALQAIACVDAAIWDVFAKAFDAPLHRLWGSCRRRPAPSASSAATTTSPTTSWET
jgi:L-alanine-DL-glutamate epimerase-like enolase superfamily enzyme